MLAVSGICPWVKYHDTLILIRLIRCVIGSWFQHVLEEVVKSTVKNPQLWCLLDLLVKFKDSPWTTMIANKKRYSYYVPRAARKALEEQGKEAPEAGQIVTSSSDWMWFAKFHQFQFVWCHGLDWYYFCYKMVLDLHILFQFPCGFPRWKKITFSFPSFQCPGGSWIGESMA